MDDSTAVIALVQENEESVLDEKLSKFQTVIIRKDAAVVAVDKGNRRFFIPANSIVEDLRSSGMIMMCIFHFQGSQLDEGVSVWSDITAAKRSYR